jgi:ribosomal protein S20
MTSSRNARRSSERRTVERQLLEALGDMRKATALLKAAESKLLSHLKTPAAGIRDRQ